MEYVFLPCSCFFCKKAPVKNRGNTLATKVIEITESIK